MNQSKIIIITMLSLLFSLTSKAQDYADSSKVKKDIPTVSLKLRDGTRLKGKIIQNDGKNYTIQKYILPNMKWANFIKDIVGWLLNN